jgi:hypothetical protein
MGVLGVLICLMTVCLIPPFVVAVIVVRTGNTRLGRFPASRVPGDPD